MTINKIPIGTLVKNSCMYSTPKHATVFQHLIGKVIGYNVDNERLTIKAIYDLPTTDIGKVYDFYPEELILYNGNDKMLELLYG